MSWFFIKINFFKKLLGIPPVSNNLDPGQDQHCRSWSGSNLFAKVIWSRWQKLPLARKEFKKSTEPTQAHLAIKTWYYFSPLDYCIKIMYFVYIAFQICIHACAICTHPFFKLYILRNFSCFFVGYRLTVSKNYFRTTIRVSILFCQA